MQDKVWESLGIESTTEVRVIKKAYAKKLKLTNPEEDPVGFQLLKEAKELAIAAAKNQQLEAEAILNSQSQFSGSTFHIVDSLYEIPQETHKKYEAPEAETLLVRLNQCFQNESLNELALLCEEVISNNENIDEYLFLENKVIQFLSETNESDALERFFSIFNWKFDYNNFRAQSKEYFYFEDIVINLRFDFYQNKIELYSALNAWNVSKAKLHFALLLESLYSKTFAKTDVFQQELIFAIYRLDLETKNLAQFRILTEPFFEHYKWEQYSPFAVRDMYKDIYDITLKRYKESGTVLEVKEAQNDFFKLIDYDKIPSEIKSALFGNFDPACITLVINNPSFKITGNRIVKEAEHYKKLNNCKSPIHPKILEFWRDRVKLVSSRKPEEENGLGMGVWLLVGLIVIVVSFLSS